MMLLAAALAIAQSQPPISPAIVEARATIRIVAAVRLKLDASENPDAPRAHDSRVKAADGSSRPARLIEFQ
jgi:hypothetical protein